MNIINYTLLNKIYDLKTLDENYLESMYQYYSTGVENLGAEAKIKKEDFRKVFSIIYDILRFKIDDETFKEVTKHYLTLLMADVYDGYHVDVYWSIDHIWYLCVGISDVVDKNCYNDCILFLQQRLINEFGIKEKFKDKVKRKIYTGFMK